MGKKVFCTWLTRAAKAGQKSLVPARRAKEGPLSFVLFEPPFDSVSSQQGPPLSIVSLGKNTRATTVLKGPKLEIFCRRVFSTNQAFMGRWLRNLEFNLIFYMFGALNFTFNRRNICLAISATALKKFLFSYVEKKVVLNCFYMHFNRPRKTFLNFYFLTCLKPVFVRF